MVDPLVDGLGLGEVDAGDLGAENTAWGASPVGSRRGLAGWVRLWETTRISALASSRQLEGIVLAGTSTTVSRAKRFPTVIPIRS